MKPPTYLGDGVYAKQDELGRLVLTTGDHDDARADNRIVLEPEVVAALIRYLDDGKGA